MAGSATAPPKRSDALSLALVLAHLAFVLAPVYVAAWLGPGPALLLCWLWVGCTMHGLLNLMHEAAHQHVFRNRSASDLLGRWLLGPLVVFDFDLYRQRHWEHHRQLGLAGDTKDAYLQDVQPRALGAFLLRCLALLESLRKLRLSLESDAGPARPAGPVGASAQPGAQSAAQNPPPRESRSSLWLLRAALVQAGFGLSILGVAWWGRAPDLSGALVAAAAAYLGVYAYGVGALTPIVATLRAVAEHQVGADAATVQGRAALRNLRCNPLSRLLLGAYGFAEHATHHARPGIPAYHLAEATRELAAGDSAYEPRRGYLATLAMLMQSPSRVEARR